MSFLIETRKLTKTFGSLTACDAVDLKVATGEIHALLGIISLLMNMEPPMIVKVLLALTSIYLFVIGGVMQLFPKLGATH